ncbi:MAG: hypothetical protein JWQ49_3513 [Edaphobacter sp.]|nr:hypothetical protein [Edaphobacter sp.]
MLPAYPGSDRCQSAADKDEGGGFRYGRGRSRSTDEPGSGVGVADEAGAFVRQVESDHRGEGEIESVQGAIDVCNGPEPEGGGSDGGGESSQRIDLIEARTDQRGRIKGDWIEDAGIEVGVQVPAVVEQALVVDEERPIRVTGYRTVRNERKRRNPGGSDERSRAGGGVDGVEIVGEVGCIQV